MRRNLRYHNVSRDANASRLRLVFLYASRSRSSRSLRALKKNNNNNNNSKQKFSIIVKTNVKASEIIDCTCAVNNENVEYSFAILWFKCDSRVGPVSQTAIFQFFSRYSEDYLKHML